MHHNLQQLQEFHAEWESKSLEELNAKLDELSGSIQNLSNPLTDDIKSGIITFLDVVPFNSGFGVASPTMRLWEKVTAHEPTEAQSFINIIEFRTLQKLLVDSKPTTIQQLSAVDVLLKVTSPITEKLVILEEQSRLLAPIITRKETELATGMKFSEEDNANVRPTEVNTPSEMHIVKDVEKTAKKSAAKKTSK